MKRNSKPVRKCRGCGLNLGDRCGVYADPKRMWHRRTCPGFKNEDMLRQFEDEQAKHPPDRPKALRREAARRRDSEPHWQGTLPYDKR